MITNVLPRFFYETQCIRYGLHIPLERETSPVVKAVVHFDGVLQTVYVCRIDK